MANKLPLIVVTKSGILMIEIKRAKLLHAKEIHNLVNEAAKEHVMLPRALGDVYEHIRDFFVAVDENEKLVGCSSLSIAWLDLAEIRSLAIKKDYMNQKIGTQLVECCINDAKEQGIKKVFALTYVVDFFKKCGFHEISKEELPHKIWGVCINCPKFPDCDEQAVAIHLK